MFCRSLKPYHATKKRLKNVNSKYFVCPVEGFFKSRFFVVKKKLDSERKGIYKAELMSNRAIKQLNLEGVL